MLAPAKAGDKVGDGGNGGSAGPAQRQHLTPAAAAARLLADGIATPHAARIYTPLLVGHCLRGRHRLGAPGEDKQDEDHSDGSRSHRSTSRVPLPRRWKLAEADLLLRLADAFVAVLHVVPHVGFGPRRAVRITPERGLRRAAGC